MKKMSNREFIHRTVYKSHVILMIISVLVGVFALTRCPSSVRHVQSDIPQARLVVNRTNEPQQTQPVDLQDDKANKKNIRHNVKPEKKIKEPKKNNPDPVVEFLALCVLGVGMLAAAAILVLMYDFVLLEVGTSAGFLLVGAAFAGILFILIFIKLIKLGKKLGKKPKDKSSLSSRNAVKTKEENGFVMNEQMAD